MSRTDKRDGGKGHPTMRDVPVGLDAEGKIGRAHV